MGTCSSDCLLKGINENEFKNLQQFMLLFSNKEACDLLYRLLEAEKDFEILVRK